MTYAIMTLILTATFVISPAFTTFTGFESNQLPIPQVDPPIQPAGYAFSIWGLIYAWLVVSAIFGVAKRGDDPAWDKARKYLCISLLVGTPWLYIATQSAVWATVAIFVMAVFALLAMFNAPRLFDRWLFQAPVALYAGWLTAASFVSLGSTMAGYGILLDSWGWAMVGIPLALAVTLISYAKRPSAPEYLVAVIWALGGIIAANGYDLVSVSYMACAGIVVLLVAMTVGVLMTPKFPASSSASTDATAG